MSTLRIFVADDHPVVREGIKALIAAQPDLVVVGEASNGRDATRLVAECAPDIVVMDVSMPELSGVEATSILLERQPGLRVLALSVHEEAAYVRRLLEVGALGYVLKRSVADILITAIRSIAAGGLYLDPLVADSIVAGVVMRPGVPSAGTPQPLSERERNVLQLIARGHSNKEIGATLGISTKTVETYKARGMEKLGLDSRVAIVRYALEHGWLM
jgi:DNA-binding NarL/FixJ family response regulator